jgi:PBP1b-binding outer membrane lipoprotein LpoB
LTTKGYNSFKSSGISAADEIQPPDFLAFASGDFMTAFKDLYFRTLKPKLFRHAHSLTISKKILLYIVYQCTQSS